MLNIGQHGGFFHYNPLLLGHKMADMAGFLLPAIDITAQHTLPTIPYHFYEILSLISLQFSSSSIMKNTCKQYPKP
jgi:hypothetical protein